MLKKLVLMAGLFWPAVAFAGNIGVDTSIGPSQATSFGALQTFSSATVQNQMQLGTGSSISTFTATSLVVDDGATLTPLGGIVGTTTNNSAAVGNYGEYMSSATASTSIANTTVYGNHGQITLTAGDWDVTASCDVVANGATVTGIQGAISINSGNTTTDHVAGTNQINGDLPTAVNDTGITISNVRQSLSGSTTVYIKLKGTFITATPTATCRISARRMR